MVATAGAAAGANGAPAGGEGRLAIAMDLQAEQRGGGALFPCSILLQGGRPAGVPRMVDCWVRRRLPARSRWSRHPGMSTSCSSPFKRFALPRSGVRGAFDVRKFLHVDSSTLSRLTPFEVVSFPAALVRARRPRVVGISFLAPAPVLDATANLCRRTETEDLLVDPADRRTKLGD